jgi:hypothetical protein
MRSNGPRNEIIAARRERQTAQLEILKNGVADVIANQSPKSLFDAGLPITAGLSIDRAATKMILLAELVRTWRAVRLPDSRSWQNQNDLQSAIDDVVELFPTLKIEEFARVMTMIRRGEITMYGRFDTPSLIAALRDYESQYTTTFRENAHHERAHNELKTQTSDRPSPADVKRFSAFVKSLDLPRPKKTIAELGGSIQLSESEMLAITKPFNDETKDTTTETD